MAANHIVESARNTGFFLTLGFLQKVGHEPGEAAGFAAMGTLLVMGRTILFVVGLILCCIAYPQVANLRWQSAIPSVLLCSTLLGTMTWRARRYQPIQVVDSYGKPIPQVRIHFDSGKDNDGFDTAGVVETDFAGKAVIHGFSPQRFSISVKTKNYYVPNGERSVFVDFQNLNGRTATPVVFHLRKKGEGVDLVKSDFPV